MCVDRRSCCGLISSNRRPGHQNRCFQNVRRRLACCSRSGCWPPKAQLSWVKSVNDPFGRRAIQHISCIRVRARAALMLARSPSARACDCTFVRRGHLVSTWGVVRVYGCICASSGTHVVACRGDASLAPRQTRAGCTVRLIPTDPGQIPQKKDD